MRRPVADCQQHKPVSAATLVAVALISAALIAYEIVLMRRLLIESWHHFGYLVISTALLGFGASGAFLALIERRVRAWPERTMFRLAVVLVLALLAMPRLATLLPVAARFIPDDLWNQVGWWSLYWLTALTPFLIGATLLGAALMTAGPQVGRVYAVNLFGSAVGAAGAVLVVSRFSIEHGLWPSVALALIAVMVLPQRESHTIAGLRRFAGVAIGLLLAVLALAAEDRWPLAPSYDEHKYAARLEHLAAQGSVRRVAARPDPHGYVELYESDLFHELPFLALSEAPPPMYSLLVNGDPAGSLLRINDPTEARVMDRTLMAFPYRLIQAQPGVLLIGETGGTNIWLARRQDAARIDVVQPNAAVIEFLRRYTPVAADARLNVYVKDPRTHLAARRRSRYDLIQIVSLEGLGVGSAGTRGLAEDHLVTVEGLTDCLRALSDDGVLAVSRGIQQPARENIRLFATLVEALELLGLQDPSGHVIQVRDYLGVCTIATRTPLTDARRQTLRAAISEFNLTPVWYDGLPIEEVNRPDALDGPPDAHVDWLHHAAREILSPRRVAFYDSWLLNVRPPHDDNPFFWDFYKPGAVAELKRVYQDQWLTRAELGRLFLYVSLLIAAGAALALILVPLAVVEFWRQSPEPGARATGQKTPRWRLRFGLARRGRAGSRVRSTTRGAALRTVVYFGGIGLGFMGIEMALISRAIRWLGDPVIASALVIGGILVVSGFGSLTARRVVGDRTWLAPVVVALAAAAIRLVGWDAPGVGPWLLLLVTTIAAYLMGMPMPTGLTLLNERSPRLVPWAWGVNGVASVIATSAAIVVAMTTGYRTVVILAAGAYALAALAVVPLARGRDSSLRPRLRSATT